MNEEVMEVMQEEAWGDGVPGEVQQKVSKDDGGGVGAEPVKGEAPQPAAAGADNRGEAAPDTPDKPPVPPAPGRISIPRGVPGRPHPLLERARENARKQGIERFRENYPGVHPDSIPREVWTQVSRGVPLDTAYALHENAQLKAQLAAERQMRLNRERTPGGLGANSGLELDELDRMWNEDD